MEAKEEIYSQESMIGFFKHAFWPVSLRHFKKAGIFSYEISGTEQNVITSIEGIIETTNTAYPGDFILTGQAGEKYVLKAETFAKRYKALDDKTAQATGECWGYVWHREPMSFQSPWGEDMIIETGDMLVSPDKEVSQVYRIEKGVFENTYAEVFE